jgi:hypothetical protein
MIHRRVAEIAERIARKAMCELCNVRQKLLDDYACKVLSLQNSLRPPRLCGE